MKILHLCLSCFYIDKAGYQENFLVRQHVEDGHDVLVIASTENFDDQGRLTYVAPQTYTGSDGAKVVRLPYVKWLPKKIARKLRIHPGVYQAITDFKPDTILFHGCAGNELVTIARYVKDHPEVSFYVDSHEDYNNSARSFVSRRILHGIFYRNRLQRALPWIKKILCVSTESIDFVAQIYKAPQDRMEFYPLGGFSLSENEAARRRTAARHDLNLSDETFVFIQSGKMTPRKKLAESLRAFSTISDENLKFFVVGMLSDTVEDEVRTLIAADPRISFLGWKSPEELTDLLCAADVYLQPGTQSATMQHALCCGCPVMIADVPAHQVYRSSGAFLLPPSTSLQDYFTAILAMDRYQMRQKALQFAQQTLDYRILAQRIIR